ncbi:hypothetical protein PN4B1_05030 [Paenibacillus naphthalenovorans]|nr:hypothetical protein PN4B1_05030 [Paenibacillus naphthalenovorans]
MKAAGEFCAMAVRKWGEAVSNHVLSGSGKPPFCISAASPYGIPRPVLYG